MKLLLENWRLYLNEAAKSAEELPDGVYVRISDSPGADPDAPEPAWFKGRSNLAQRLAPAAIAGIRIEYVDKIYAEPRINGYILIVDGSEGPGFESQPCGGAYAVGASEADHGWGPLLYDIAMEYATEAAGGLTPSSAYVSSDAQKVWDYYLHKRSHEVERHQLDDPDNTLTPEDEDNCHQYSSQRRSGWLGLLIPDKLQGVDWKSWDNPLSKRYTKAPTTIQKLKSLDKLEISL